jgi:hypothetical protein
MNSDTITLTETETIHEVKKRGRKPKPKPEIEPEAKKRGRKPKPININDLFLKKQQNAKYQAEYMKKNKDLVIKKYKCEQCGGSYTHYNKFHHNQSKKHLYIVNFKMETMDKLNNILTTFSKDDINNLKLPDPFSFLKN